MILRLLLISLWLLVSFHCAKEDDDEGEVKSVATALDNDNKVVESAIKTHITGFYFNEEEPMEDGGSTVFIGTTYFDYFEIEGNSFLYVAYYPGGIEAPSSESFDQLTLSKVSEGEFVGYAKASNADESTYIIFDANNDNLVMDMKWQGQSTENFRFWSFNDIDPDRIYPTYIKMKCKDSSTLSYDIARFDKEQSIVLVDQKWYGFFEKENQFFEVTTNTPKIKVSQLDGIDPETLIGKCK